MQNTICDLCGKCFTNKNPKSSLFKHKIWCSNKNKFLKDYSLSAETVSQEYQNLGSVLAFQEKYPFWTSFSHYYRLFKELGVEVSSKHAANSSVVIAKRRKSSLDKYGFEHNFCSGHPSRLRWEKELFENEGITNVFQREDVKRKISSSIVNKYGKELWRHTLTVRGSGIISQLNKKVFNVLEENNIEFVIEFKISRSDGGHYYAYDVLLGENKIIEIYGDYWHGNPEIYKPNDLLLKGSSKEIKMSDKWKADKEKIDFVLNRGYSVLIVWENDLKNNFEVEKDRILSYARN